MILASNRREIGTEHPPIQRWLGSLIPLICLPRKMENKPYHLVI